MKDKVGMSGTVSVTIRLRDTTVCPCNYIRY